MSEHTKAPDGAQQDAPDAEDLQDGPEDQQQEAGEDRPSAFERAIAEGERRLRRDWGSLLATGAVGGIDVGIGVFALLLVMAETDSVLLSGLAFGVGFIALTLAGSELFTENFLVPIAAITADRAKPASLLRLWAGTAVTNLAGGWVMMFIIISALPQLQPTAVEVGQHYIDLGIGWQSFATAVLGGTVITLMTWMEHGHPEGGTRVVAAVIAAFLLGAGELNHVIVVSLEIFAAFQGTAPYGYAEWVVVALWAALGNMVGGIGLVTILRLVQVGKPKVQHERRRSADARRVLRP